MWPLVLFIVACIALVLPAREIGRRSGGVTALLGGLAYGIVGGAAIFGLGTALVANSIMPGEVSSAAQNGALAGALTGAITCPLSAFMASRRRRTEETHRNL